MTTVLGQLAMDTFFGTVSRLGSDGAWDLTAATIARECLKVLRARAEGYETALADEGQSAKLRDICTRNAFILQGTIEDIEALIAEVKP
jgi:hypothetical protein